MRDDLIDCHEMRDSLQFVRHRNERDLRDDDLNERVGQRQHLTRESPRSRVNDESATRIWSFKEGQADLATAFDWKSDELP
jgi:hypothetical protein